MEMGIVDNSNFDNDSILLINALSMAIDYANRAANPADVVDTATAFYDFLVGESRNGI